MGGLPATRRALCLGARVQSMCMLGAGGEGDGLGVACGDGDVRLGFCTGHGAVALREGA